MGRAPALFVVLAVAAAAGCSRKEPAAVPEAPVVAALPPGPAVYVEIDLQGALGANAEQREAIESLIPNGCIDLYRETRNVVVAWYADESGGVVVAATGPSAAAVRGCLETVFEWKPGAPASGGPVRYTETRSSHRWDEDRNDLVEETREEFVGLLLSPSGDVHLLAFGEAIGRRLADGGSSGGPAGESAVDLVRLVPEGPIVAATAMREAMQESVREMIEALPQAEGIRPPVGVAVSIRAGTESTSATGALKAEDAAQAELLEGALGLLVEQGRSILRSQVDLPSSPAGLRKVLRALEGVSIRRDGNVVRISITIEGPLFGLLSAASSWGALQAYWLFREFEVDHRVNAPVEELVEEPVPAP